MRVILLTDVDRLGHEGDVVEVRAGHARNLLIPRGLAAKATPGALRDLQLRRSAIDRRHLDRREAAQAVAARIKDKPVTIGVMVGERGRLHGRVTTTQLAQAVQEQLGVTVDRRNIELHEAIKAVGDYVITARLFSDVQVNVPVRVRPLGLEEAEEVEEPEPQGLAAADDDGEVSDPVEATATLEEPAAEAEQE
jgi:large subunit ribosomal protein L9